MDTSTRIQQQQSTEEGVFVLDSCNSTWVFDTVGKRFRRLLKGLQVDHVVASTEWRSYDRIELSEESEAFTVVLNAAGTRRIRSWRHVEGCQQCRNEPTTEFSLEELRHLTAYLRLTESGLSSPDRP